MDDALLQELKSQLEEEKKSLREELDRISTPDTGDHVPGDRAAKFPNYGDDAMDENTNSPHETADYEQNISVTHTLEERMGKVTAALERMANGSYGKDIETGTEIDIERLKADPAADKNIA